MSFFVQRLSEYNTLEENIKIRDIRLRQFEAILKEQFQLAYFGKISYESSEKMTIQERHTVYAILIEQKKAERKAQEDSIRESKAKNNNHSWRRKR